MIEDEKPWYINVQAWAAKTKANVAVSVKGPSLKHFQEDLSQSKEKAPQDVEPPSKRGRTTAPRSRSTPPEADRSRSRPRDESLTGPKEPCLTQMDTTQSSTMDVDPDQRPATVADQELNPAKNDALLIDAAEALANGWQERDLQGNGDCFFRSVAAAQAWQSKRKELNEKEATAQGAWLRTITVKHVRKHYGRFLECWTPPSSQGEKEATTFDKWLDLATTKRTQSLGTGHPRWPIWIQWTGLRQ